jgi:hypothetical protein
MNHGELSVRRLLARAGRDLQPTGGRGHQELGHDLPGARLALVVENIFDKQSLQHEIGLYYRVTWPAALDPGDLYGGSEPGHTFRWVPFRELGDLDFRPAGLVTILPDLDDTVRHVVLDRLDRAPA